MKTWIRLYTKIPDDPKVQSLPPVLFRFWINCLCIAARADGNLPPIEQLAFALREPTSKIEPMAKKLVAAGLLDVDPSGTFRPHEWNDWQYESDGSTERVKRFRERSKKQDGNATCNGRASESVSDSESVSGFEEKKGCANSKNSPGLATPGDMLAMSLHITEEYSPMSILDELKPIYRQAGKPIPESQEQMLIQYLIDIDPPERRRRVVDYVKWALVTGNWSDAAHTKSLVNLLRDPAKEWDVELSVRTLPNALKTKAEIGQDEAAKRFLRGREDAGTEAHRERS